MTYMQLRITPHISDALEACRGRSHGHDSVSHKELIELARELPDPWTLRGLLRGTSVYNTPPPPPVPKSKDFIELMEKLRNDEAEREYQQMLGKPTSQQPTVVDPQEMKDMKEQLTTVVNIMISIFSVGFAVWYWSSSISDSYRVLLAVFGSIVTAIAEAVVYLGYRRRLNEARESAQHESVKLPDEVVLNSPEKELPRPSDESPDRKLRHRKVN